MDTVGFETVELELFETTTSRAGDNFGSRDKFEASCALVEAEADARAARAASFFAAFLRRNCVSESVTILAVWGVT